MARFRFSLEQLLRLRSQQTQQAAAVLQQVLAQRRTVEEHLQRLRQLYESAHCEETSPKTIAAHELHDAWAYRCYLLQEVERSQQQCERLRELEAVQHRHFQRAWQAQEVLHRLRDRRWEAFQAAESQAEQRQLDEVGQRHRGHPWRDTHP